MPWIVSQLVTQRTAPGHGARRLLEGTMTTIQAPSFVDLLRSAVTEPGLLHAAFTRFHNYSLGNEILARGLYMHRAIELGPMTTEAVAVAMAT